MLVCANENAHMHTNMPGACVGIGPMIQRQICAHHARVARPIAIPGGRALPCPVVPAIVSPDVGRHLPEIDDVLYMTSLVFRTAARTREAEDGSERPGTDLPIPLPATLHTGPSVYVCGQVVLPVVVV